MKVYAVYSIPKSPEYKLERLFKTKESAKKYIKSQKEGFSEKISEGVYNFVRFGRHDLFDIQIEEILE